MSSWFEDFESIDEKRGILESSAMLSKYCIGLFFEKNTQMCDLAYEATQHACMHWGKKWQPTPIFLPGESQGWRSLVGCHPWSRIQLDTTEATQQQQHLIVNCFTLEGTQSLFVVEINSGKELFKLLSLSGQEQCRIPLGMEWGIHLLQGGWLIVVARETN